MEAARTFTGPKGVEHPPRPNQEKRETQRQRPAKSKPPTPQQAGDKAQPPKGAAQPAESKGKAQPPKGAAQPAESKGKAQPPKGGKRAPAQASQAKGGATAQRDAGGKQTGRPGRFGGWTYSESGTPLHPNHDGNLARLLMLLQTVVPLHLRPTDRPIYEAHGPNTTMKMTWDDTCTEKTREGARVLFENDGKSYDPVDFIWHIGNMIKKLGISIVNQCTRGKQVQYPPGASVISPSDEFYREKLPKIAEAFKQMAEHQNRMPSPGFYHPMDKVKGKMILGYIRPPDGEKHPERYYTPTLADVISYLSEELQEVVIAYLKGIADFIGAPYESIVRWKLIIPVYPGEDSTIKVDGPAGFPPHTDGIASFDSYPGMVFNVAMGLPFTHSGEENKKYFDYIHLFDRDTHYDHKKVHRMELKQGDVSITSGLSRFFWAHGVPEQPNTQLTLAIKTDFIEFRSDKPEYIETVNPHTAAFNFANRPVTSVNHNRPVTSVNHNRPVTSVNHRAAMKMHGG
jgi:hypothetical protein